MKTKEKILEEVGDRHYAQEYEVSWNMAIEAMELYAQQQVKNLNIPVVMPRISHFTDENGNYVDICAGGVNVILKRDGSHFYFRSYGFAGRMKLTPIYVA